MCAVCLDEILVHDMMTDECVLNDQINSGGDFLSQQNTIMSIQ